MPTLSIFKSGSGRHQDLASLKSGTGCPSILGGASHRLLQSRRERGRETEADGEKSEDREKRKRGAGGRQRQKKGEGRDGRERKRVGREGSGKRERQRAPDQQVETWTETNLETEAG